MLWNLNVFLDFPLGSILASNLTARLELRQIILKTLSSGLAK